MVIQKVPFQNYTLDEERKDSKEEVISLKLNLDERKLLDECKQQLQQKRDGTAIKQLMMLGAKVIRDEKTAFILDTVFKNKRNNARSGIVEFDSWFLQK